MRGGEDVRARVCVCVPFVPSIVIAQTLASAMAGGTPLVMCFLYTSFVLIFSYEAI